MSWDCVIYAISCFFSMLLFTHPSCALGQLHNYVIGCMVASGKWLQKTKSIFLFLVAPSLRAERLIWSLWRVSGCLSVHFYLTEGPPPPHKSSHLKNSKTKMCFSSFWATFLGGGPPAPVKGKIFDTRFGLIHVQTGKIFFFKTKFLAKFFYAHFIELAQLSVSQFSS